MASVLQSASRESLAAATARLDAHVDATGASDLSRLADDLFAVLGLLDREHALRRALADPATPAACPHRPRRPAALAARSGAPRWTSCRTW